MHTILSLYIIILIALRLIEINPFGTEKIVSFKRQNGEKNRYGKLLKEKEVYQCGLMVRRVIKFSI